MNEILVKSLESWMLDTIRFEERDAEIKQHIAEIMHRPDARLFGAIESKYDDNESKFDRLVAIGGVWKFGYIFGEWGLWLTSEVKERPFWLVKNCLRFMDIVCMELDVRRVIALADKDRPESIRFLECLGFKMDRTPIRVEGLDCYVFEKAVI